jgi:hypothetical protein
VFIEGLELVKLKGKTTSCSSLYTNAHTNTPKKQIIMTTKLSSIFLSAALFVGILSSSAIFPSTLAAKPDPFNDVHAKGVYASDSFTGTICGVTDTFTEKAHLTQFHIRGNDNGHFIAQWTQTVKVYDSNGKLIATTPIMQHTTGVGGTDKIHTIQKAPITCTGASETPGKSSNICYGIEIGLEFDPELSWKVTDYDAFIC